MRMHIRRDALSISFIYDYIYEVTLVGFSVPVNKLQLHIFPRAITLHPRIEVAS